jgi:hypothetical protein
MIPAEGVRVTKLQKPQKDCDCPCHKGARIVHVVPCCEGLVLGQTKQKPEPGKPNDSN